MKDLLSKEQYCHKIQTPLTTSSTYLPFIDNPPPRPPPKWVTPPFLQENFTSLRPSITFQKSQSPLQIREVYTLMLNDND